MNTHISRRSAIRNLTGGAAVLSAAVSLSERLSADDAAAILENAGSR